MTDIGNTLREARIRRKIEISAVEDAIKIRSKYLRALEAEEFDALPEPAYVKTFLRTYAIYLGLDPHPLVDKYRDQFEKIEEYEPAPLQTIPEPRERMSLRMQPPRWTLLAALMVGLVALLTILYITGADESDEGQSSKQATNAKTSSKMRSGSTKSKGRKTGREGVGSKRNAETSRLTLVAKNRVWVCLVDADGNPKITSDTLEAGETKGPFKSKFFRASFGNGSVEVKVNGKSLEVSQATGPLGYRIGREGLKPLPEAERPNCR